MEDIIKICFKCYEFSMAVHLHDQIVECFCSPTQEKLEVFLFSSDPCNL